MQLVITIGLVGIQCVTLPGWVVVVVAMLLTAPRLVGRFLDKQ